MLLGGETHRDQRIHHYTGKCKDYITLPCYTNLQRIYICHHHQYPLRECSQKQEKRFVIGDSDVSEYKHVIEPCFRSLLDLPASTFQIQQMSLAVTAAQS